MMKKFRDFTNTLLNYNPSVRMKYTFGAVVFVGILAHLYMYCNRIVNHDAVFALNSSGATITSGRWFLHILTELSFFFTNNYVTPWGIGCVTIALYGMCACLIVSIYNVKNKWLCAALGSLLISFPSITSINLYIFTAHYYAFACLLACLSVYVVNRKVSPLSVTVSALLLMLSLGIYQAYLPFVLSMYVILIIFRCLRSNEKIGMIFLTAGGFLASIILGLISYFIANRISLSVSGLQMDSYMGLDTMGLVNLKNIPEIIFQCYYKFINLFFEHYCGINHKSWLRIFMLLGFVLFIALALYKMVKQKVGWIKCLLGIIAIVIMPIAINAAYIMIPVDIENNTIVVFATVFVFLCPILISNELIDVLSVKNKRALYLCTLVATSAVTIYYSSLANETYISLEYSNKNVTAYYTELATQIKSMDNFSPEFKVAFVGDAQDPTIPEIGCDYILRGTFTSEELINAYSREFYMSLYCGYSPVFVDDTSYLEKDIRVQEMPTYPSAGSIQIIDDIVVIRFS